LELSDFFNNDQFKRSHLGIYVVEVDTQKEIYSFNPDQYFIPSSVLKVITGALALNALGEEFCFHTDLKYEGVIDSNKVLHGNVWIVGGGDPTLSLNILDVFEQALKDLGVYQIDGKIIADASCFEKEMSSQYWYVEDVANGYGAGASGLTINKNSYEITFKPGSKEGEKSQVLKIEPNIVGLKYHNEVCTGPKGSGDRVNVFGAEYNEMQFYKGTVPLEEPTFRIKGAIFNPPLFLAQALNSKMHASKGVQVIWDKTGDNTTLLLKHKSVPLKDILKEMNFFSINLYAEHLLKKVGEGKTSLGVLKMQKFLDNLNIPAKITDGCGLSRNNLLTPKGVVKLLCEIKKSKAYSSLYNSLPGIREGTLTYVHLKNSSLKAKTGAMAQICNLAGYLILPSKKEYAFCIFCNNYLGDRHQIKEEIHNFLEALAEK
ncbi:MAG: D-alanyl-D-alanine carboxypeptidase/D-alanyl-D-alanine-endopeptidase, partial [Chlamydiae bacterium]|nr:D-alanyl-D-alanine carboxypeptidase/D-alanyl-D-alanine-endopeptidase [Chlamydiota bacterium]